MFSNTTQVLADFLFLAVPLTPTTHHLVSNHQLEQAKAGQLIVNHIEDYGFLRYEIGYAAAVSVVLLLMVLFFTRISNRLFGSDR